MKICFFINSLTIFNIYPFLLVYIWFSKECLNRRNNQQSIGHQMKIHVKKLQILNELILVHDDQKTKQIARTPPF